MIWHGKYAVSINLPRHFCRKQNSSAFLQKYLVKEGENVGGGIVGAGNATTALAQMMQCKVDMSVPRVQLLEFKDLEDDIEY